MSNLNDILEGKTINTKTMCFDIYNYLRDYFKDNGILRRPLRNNSSSFTVVLSNKKRLAITVDEVLETEDIGSSCIRICYSKYTPDQVKQLEELLESFEK